MQVDAIIFDKDGTLFDFSATWDQWAAQMIAELSEGDAEIAQNIARAIRFDQDACAFLPDSPVIAGTNREAAEAVASGMVAPDVDAIEVHLMRGAAEAPLAPAVPLAPYLAGLRARGVKLAVMTNDTEYGAHSHLNAAGVADLFDHIIGFDSGHGAKPQARPLLALAEMMGTDPAHTVMVGDSTHDLIAGRAAGMQTVAVLTGLAGAAELAPYADHVLADIGHLPQAFWPQ